MKQVTKPRSSRESANVPWKELPHAWLDAEIHRVVARRHPSEADRDVRMEELARRLKEMALSDHCEYTSLVVREIKRELRISRDQYQEYLKGLNSKSRTAKWRVALEHEVAPRAGRRLCEEAKTYLELARVDKGVVDFLFLSGNSPALFLPISEVMKIMSSNDYAELALFFGGTTHGFRTMEDHITPESFQHLKDRLKDRKNPLPCGGPFSRPLVRSVESWKLYDENEVWISQLREMWDGVLREIMEHHIEIDLEEQANALHAVETLSLFKRRAGLLCWEALDRYKYIPDDVWVLIGKKLDDWDLPLKENLERSGRDVLRDELLEGRRISKWADALTQINEGNLKFQIGYPNDIRRCAQRVIYRAGDAYRAALDKVYERRVSLRDRVDGRDGRLA